MSAESPYAELLAELPTRSSSVRIMGGDTKYWVYGPEDAATTIVAVHGYRGEHHGLEPVIAQLRGIRIVSPDLPGFGLSDPLPHASHDISGYSAWLRSFMDAMGLTGTSIILGHSFGSIITSAAVAGGLPTPKLILVNPIAAPALSGPNGFLSRLTLVFYRAARALPEPMGRWLLGNRLVVQVMTSVLVKTKDPALKRWIYGQHNAYFSKYANRDVAVEGFEASIGSDVSMFAAKIEVPTLLVAADLDPISTVAAEKKLQAMFPDARLTILDDVGHLVHYEKPREAAEAIVGFLGVGALADEPVTP